MIRVEIDLFVVEETENAYWLSDVPKHAYEDYRLQLKEEGGDLRSTLRELHDYFFMRVAKDTGNVREFISERLGVPCRIFQMASQWPSKIDLSKECV